MAPFLNGESELSKTFEPVKNGVDAITAWADPSPAAFDFRSDVCTTSTPVMLKAVTEFGINDGWSASGAKHFEEIMARLCGRESAAFMVSSTMGNQASLRAHFETPPMAVLCDERSHLIHQEAGAVGSLSGALATTVAPSNGLYLTVEDIKRKVVLSDGTDACTCPTRVLHIENPLGGVIMPLNELWRIRRFADEKNLKLHMDGARLWEAVASGAGSLQEYCAAAHSVNLCLTKSLGAPVGSIVVGDKDFIHSAKWVRKSVGGSMRQPGVVAAAALAAVKEAFGTDPSGSESCLGKNTARARQLAEVWLAAGGKLTVPHETNMLWLDLDAAGITEDEWEERAKEFGIIVYSSRIVVHYQISDKAMKALENFMTTILRERAGKPIDISDVPRNSAVSRLAASMRDPVLLADQKGRRLQQRTPGRPVAATRYTW